MDINTSAPVITYDEITIHSSLNKIWDLDTNISRCKEWNRDISKSEVYGQIEVGATFTGAPPVWI